MNLPLIMHGSTLIYEVGDDLEEDVAANYARNLNKVYGVHYAFSCAMRDVKIR